MEGWDVGYNPEQFVWVVVTACTYWTRIYILAGERAGEGASSLGAGL